MQLNALSSATPDLMMPPVTTGDEVVSFAPPAPDPQTIKLQQQVMELHRLASMRNAADAFDEGTLANLGQKVCREFKIDQSSRDEWEKSARRAMDMARQKKEGKSEPWENASNVKYPMLTTAALQFAARAYPAIVDGPRIVKCAVLGRDPDGMKAGQADRVSQHMSFQLLNEVPEWESDVDTLLHQLPVVGCAFKKVFEDDTVPAGFGSEMVSAFDFVVNQKTKSLDTVPRATHVFKLYPHEINERVRDERFLEFDPRQNQEDGEDSESPHTFLEQHRYWDADGDGVDEPWIVTVHEGLQKVVRITPCFDVDKIEFDMRRGRILRIPRKQYFVKVPFIPDPEGGFYDIGFGKLLEALSDVIDTTINQMMDAGSLQNSGGGFVSGSLKLGRNKLRFKPGEYHSVPMAGDDIRKSIVNMEHPGASPVLFQLLSLMIDAGKDIASVKDLLTGETPENQTATSTMAAIEQGLKVFTAIYKRIFRALKTEFKLIFEINKRSLKVEKYVALMDDPIVVSNADYQGEFDVCPVADPNMVTDMQRMAKAQFLMEQVANGNPHVNPFEATKRALEAARIERAEEVLIPPPPPDQPPPPTPEQIAIEAKAKEAELAMATRTQMAEIDAAVKTRDAETRLQTETALARIKIGALEAEIAAKAQDRELERAHKEAMREIDLSIGMDRLNIQRATNAEKAASRPAPE